MLRRAAQAVGPEGSACELLACEDRRSLLEEGAHAFDLIGGARAVEHSPAFFGECFVEGCNAGADDTAQHTGDGTVMVAERIARKMLVAP